MSEQMPKKITNSDDEDDHTTNEEENEDKQNSSVYRVQNKDEEIQEQRVTRVTSLRDFGESSLNEDANRLFELFSRLSVETENKLEDQPPADISKGNLYSNEESVPNSQLECESNKEISKRMKIAKNSDRRDVGNFCKNRKVPVLGLSDVLQTFMKTRTKIQVLVEIESSFPKIKEEILTQIENIKNDSKNLSYFTNSFKMEPVFGLSDVRQALESVLTCTGFVVGNETNLFNIKEIILNAIENVKNSDKGIIDNFSNNLEMIPVFGLSDVRRALERSRNWGDIVIEVRAIFPTRPKVIQRRFLYKMNEYLNQEIGRQKTLKKCCRSHKFKKLELKDIPSPEHIKNELNDFLNAAAKAIIEFIEANPTLHEELKIELQAKNFLDDNCKIQ